MLCHLIVCKHFPSLNGSASQLLYYTLIRSHFSENSQLKPGQVYWPPYDSVTERLSISASIMALIGLAFVNEQVKLTGLTALWHDVFVDKRRVKSC